MAKSNEKVIETFDMTPTWVSLVDGMIAIVRDGETRESAQGIREELLRMAKAADKYIELQKQDKTMNLNLKAVFYCATAGRRWGKGYTPAEAMKNAGLTAGRTKGIEYYVQAVMLNNPTEAELKNIHNCITADNFSGSPAYYRDNRTEEDTEMINRLHVGWVMIESTVKKEQA